MGAVRYLLDTHAFLWAVSDSQRLGVKAREVIEDSTASIFLSAVSAYEIMNKCRIGKLPGYAQVAEDYLEILRQLGADELPIRTKHAHYAGQIEWDHRDPFDRLLAAQALIDDLTLISNDSAFQSLPALTVLW